MNHDVLNSLAQTRASQGTPLSWPQMVHHFRNGGFQPQQQGSTGMPGMTNQPMGPAFEGGPIAMSPPAYQGGSTDPRYLGPPIHMNPNGNEDHAQPIVDPRPNFEHPLNPAGTGPTGILQRPMPNPAPQGGVPMRPPIRPNWGGGGSGAGGWG